MLNIKKFGRRLVYLRRTAKLTQKEVAVRCSVSVQAVSKWELGRSCPDILILDDLAAALGVGIQDLFIFDDDAEA